MKYYQFFKINNNKNNSDQTINKKKNNQNNHALNHCMFRYKNNK